MTRRRKIQLQQLLFIIVAWQLVALAITCYDYSLIQATEFRLQSENYSFALSLLYNSVGGLFGALTAGSFLVLYLNEKFTDKPYSYSILTICALFIASMSLIQLMIGVIWTIQAKGIAIGDPAFYTTYLEFLTDSYRIKDILAWSIVTGLTQFLLLISIRFGHGVLWNIIRGRYHFPKEEFRIFMFADINDSTTLAEKLGDERYHQMLKDFFSDITNPIVNNSGDIYQYIGDEVVVAWKYEDAIVNNQCIRCFFDMRAAIEQRKELYLSKYGLVPDFKAGIHFGKVIAGEIGIIKRDITYSGDVLNTTARIENKCREFNVDLIASDELLAQLSFVDQYVSRKLGSFALKGKTKEIELSALLARVAI